MHSLGCFRRGDYTPPAQKTNRFLVVNARLRQAPRATPRFHRFSGAHVSWRLSSSAPCLTAPHRPCVSHRRAQPPTPLSVAHPCEKKQGQDKCFAPLFFSCGALGGVFTRARARYRLCSYLVGARGRSLVRCARGGVAGGSAVVWDFYFTAPRPFVARLRPPELDIGAGGTDILILGRLFEMSRARQVCCAHS